VSDKFGVAQADRVVIQSFGGSINFFDGTKPTDFAGRLSESVKTELIGSKQLAIIKPGQSMA